MRERERTKLTRQGGTSGIGASVVYELASRGAQVIILTQHSPSDVFLVEYIEDLRKNTGNQLIYAEQVDLSSLHSIRTFATKWIDNAPPRRLDMLILCASTVIPSGAQRKPTVDGLDEEWQVNYLGNFHLLSILSPALRVQPSHRDVRVIFTTCPSYIGAPFDLSLAGQISSAQTAEAAKNKKKAKAAAAPQQKKKTSGNTFSLSKLSLMIFARTFQAHLNAYKRPDGQPPCTRVMVVDPGFSRTPGTRRWLTGGSLWGLLVYLVTWPLWWLILKSPQQGAQSILYAAMEARYGTGDGGWMIKECREVDFARRDVGEDPERAKELWEFSDKQIEEREKEGAVLRALEKKEREEVEKRDKEDKGANNEPAAGSRRSRRNK